MHPTGGVFHGELPVCFTICLAVTEFGGPEPRYRQPRLQQRDVRERRREDEGLDRKIRRGLVVFRDAGT